LAGRVPLSLSSAGSAIGFGLAGGVIGSHGKSEMERRERREREYMSESVFVVE